MADAATGKKVVTVVKQAKYGMTMVPMTRLREMLEMFVSGEDRSLAVAGEIEVALEDYMGDTEPFATVVLALASYRPGGGSLLYGEAEMVPLMAQALRALPRSPDAGETDA